MTPVEDKEKTRDICLALSLADILRFDGTRICVPARMLLGSLSCGFAFNKAPRLTPRSRAVCVKFLLIVAI